MPTIRTRTCPNCARPIGHRGHRCRKGPRPILTARPADFDARVRAARNAAAYTQPTLDFGATP